MRRFTWVFGVVFCLGSLCLSTAGGLGRAPIGLLPRFDSLPAQIETLGAGTLHRIGVRKRPGRSEFYDTVTSRKFTPRGNNYIRLALQSVPGGEDYLYHSTFNVGLYNRTLAAEALAKMHESGYNIVRVFISEQAVGREDGKGGLSMGYLRNVVDFLRLAKANGIYVIPTLSSIPVNGNYYDIRAVPHIESVNSFYLNKGFIRAKIRYLQDFIRGLQALRAPLNAVFSYSLENEAYYLEDQEPLSLASGSVTTANGKTYDMSVPGQKQQMMDENLVYWINSVRSGIRLVYGSALVCVGFFSPMAVEGAEDPRIIRTYWAIADSSIGGSRADYVDLHFYPGLRDTYQEMNSFEIAGSHKPLVLGEFGAFRFLYPDSASAATALRDFQVLSCVEYGFTGWLAWTWDTTEQPELFSVLEDNGMINNALAPVVRTNPCAY
jgi:hypothetical protein